MGIVNNYEAIRTKTVAIVGVGGVGSGKFLFPFSSLPENRSKVLKLIVKMWYPKMLAYFWGDWTIWQKVEIILCSRLFQRTELYQNFF